jgi:hypothetical protein
MAANPDVSWLLLTEQPVLDAPPNVAVQLCEFEDLAKRIRSHFEFEIALERPYKLCDFRPAFGEIFADELTTVVCTTVAGTNRALSPEVLGERAAGIFGEERVRVAPNLADAIEVAVGLADEAGPGAGVLIAGSVIAAGQARALLVRGESA